MATGDKGKFFRHKDRRLKDFLFYPGKCFPRSFSKPNLCMSSVIFLKNTSSSVASRPALFFVGHLRPWQFFWRNTSYSYLTDFTHLPTLPCVCQRRGKPITQSAFISRHRQLFFAEHVSALSYCRLSSPTFSALFC